MKIAFIGLGNMGGPMAHNLHKAGHEVRAFDLSQPARDKLAQETAARARTEALAVGLARTAESLMIQQAAAQADAASKAGEATSASLAKRRTQETTEKLSTAGVRASRTAKNERPPWR